MLPLSRTSTLALRQRRAHLVRAFALPPDLLHASVVERFVKCGKANCRCRDGPKHGPFFYLSRCFGAGQVQALLLKSSAQIDQARQGVDAYAQALAVLDEVSQINRELLRRGEPLAEPAA